MFRTFWGHPQGDIYICSMVCFTGISVSSLVDKSECSRLLFTRLLTTLHVKHTILHVQLSP